MFDLQVIKFYILIYIKLYLFYLIFILLLNKLNHNHDT
jgi:hypothetical protein